MELKQLTEQLIVSCDDAVNRFYKMREEDRDPDFFGEVKPYADHVHAQLKVWQQQSKQFIDLYQPKHFHYMQVDNAVEAMEQFTVQSFYKKTSKKRFIQSVQSVHYTLSKFLRYVNEEGTHAE